MQAQIASLQWSPSFRRFLARPSGAVQLASLFRVCLVSSIPVIELFLDRCGFVVPLLLIRGFRFHFVTESSDLRWSFRSVHSISEPVATAGLTSFNFPVPTTYSGVDSPLCLQLRRSLILFHFPDF